MGTVFEELIRRFNEENNEEAGEHWTPRDAVKLMANLIFLPIADQVESGAYLLYDLGKPGRPIPVPDPRPGHEVHRIVRRGLHRGRDADRAHPTAGAEGERTRGALGPYRPA